MSLPSRRFLRIWETTPTCYKKMTCRHVQIRFQKFGSWWYIVIVIDQIPLEVDYFENPPPKAGCFFRIQIQISIISGAICLNTIPFNSNHFLKFTSVGNRPPFPIWSKASMVPHSCDQWTRTVSHRDFFRWDWWWPPQKRCEIKLWGVLFSLDRKSMKIPFLRFWFSLLKCTIHFFE